MLDDHDKFIEGVIEEVVNKKKLMTTRKARKAKEAAVIESLMDVTGLSRNEVKKIMEKTRKKHLSIKSKPNNGALYLKAAAFIVLLIALVFGVMWIMSPSLRSITYQPEKKLPVESFVAEKKAPEKPIAKKPPVNKTETLAEIPEDSYKLDWSKTSKQIIKTAPVKLIQTADINKDGNEDIVSYFYEAGEFYWFKNDGEGNVKEYLISDEESDVIDFVVADYDSDGDMDIVMASYENSRIVWFENNESNQFKRHVISTEFSVSTIRVADLNNNKIMDVVFNSGKAFRWIEYNADEKFTVQSIDTELRNDDVSFELGDMDDNGLVDIVYVDYTQPNKQGLYSAKWIENNGINIYEGQGITIVNGHSLKPANIVLADRNNDGFLDIIIADKKSDRITTIICKGEVCDDMMFFTPNFYGVNSLLMEDMNNDGDLDLVLGSKVTGMIAHFEATGIESFDRELLDKIAVGFESILTVDINNDGYRDLVVASSRGLILYTLNASK